jgi:hypothetical protein cdivTM_10742
MMKKYKNFVYQKLFIFIWRYAIIILREIREIKLFLKRNFYG